jgi:prepilin signal peptidase PulO-like enzyme (type II secretory pathway)
MPHFIYIAFLFALGSCIGSFLNVVVWRVPNIEHKDEAGFLALIREFFTTLHGLSEPPSHCPNCKKLLKWYDNIPVLGWIKLGGKCRFCKVAISKRYPIVEAITGLMFAGYYVAFFVLQIGPCRGVTAGGQIHHAHLIISHDWWLYGLDMALLCALLAASLIDAELFQIPIEIPWVIVPLGLAAHAFFDMPGEAGSLMTGPLPAALALGAAVGTVLSIILVNYKIFPRSFAEGDPLLDVERRELERQRREEEQRQEQKKSRKKKNKNKANREEEKPAKLPVVSDAEREWKPGEIRREIGKEMVFLLPPLMLGMLCMVLVMRVEPIAQWWGEVVAHRWIASLLGSILGGLVGGFTVWFTRILGSLGFGKQAMGMGDVDLMVAVGVVLGPGPAAVAFFIAPFFGIAFSIYLLFTSKQHEVPYGPYLSLATAFVILFYCPIAAYFAPGLVNLAWMLSRSIGGG